MGSLDGLPAVKTCNSRKTGICCPGQHPTSLRPQTRVYCCGSVHSRKSPCCSSRSPPHLHPTGTRPLRPPPCRVGSAEVPTTVWRVENSRRTNRLGSSSSPVPIGSSRPDLPLLTDPRSLHFDYWSNCQLPPHPQAPVTTVYPLAISPRIRD